MSQLYTQLSGAQKLTEKDYASICTILLQESTKNPEYKEFVEEYFSSWPVLQSILKSHNNEEITKGLDLKILEAIR